MAVSNLGRSVVAGSLGLGWVLYFVVPIEGPLLNLLGHYQSVPIDLVAERFVVVVAGLGLALRLPWLPSGAVLMWAGPWMSLWMGGVSPLAREFGLEPAV